MPRNPIVSKPQKKQVTQKTNDNVARIGRGKKRVTEVDSQTVFFFALMGVRRMRWSYGIKRGEKQRARVARAWMEGGSIKMDQE